MTYGLGDVWGDSIAASYITRSYVSPQQWVLHRLTHVDLGPALNAEQFAREHRKPRLPWREEGAF